MKRIIFFQILFIAMANIAFSQRTKLFQLEQKGVPHEGYAGVTNADGNQVYQLVDLSSTNEIQTYGHSGTTSYTNTLSLGGGSFTLQASTGIGISNSGGVVTFTNTGDVSNTNELQSYGHSGFSSYTNTLSGGGGSFSLFAGSGIGISNSFGNVTITASDVSSTNELQSYGHSGSTSYTNTLSSGGGSFSLFAGTGISISHSSGSVTISSTSTLSGTTNYVTKWTSSSTIGNSQIRDDGSTVGIGTAPISGIMTQWPSGDIRVGFNTGTTNRILFGDASYVFVGEQGADDRLYLNGSSMAVVVNGQAGSTGQAFMNTSGLGSWQNLPDGSATNELQSYGHSGTTSYTNTLSSGGGSFTLQASTGIGISNSGGTVTITNTGDVSNTNEIDIFSFGANGSYAPAGNGSFLNFVGSGIASTSRSGTTITITATEVDGSTTNELQTFGHSGTTSYTNTLSSGGGSFSLLAGSGIGISNSSGSVTITASDVSSTNELQSYGHSGTTSYTNTLSSGGGSFTLQSSGIIGISNSSGTVTISATEVDGSTTNELQTFGHSGTTSYTNTLSSGGGSFTLQAGSGIGISNSSGTVTISNTASSGSFSTSGGLVTSISGVGGSFEWVPGSGISISNIGSSGTARLQITATDVSSTNELQSFGHSGTTSYTNTLSSGGGSFTLQASGIVSISNSSGTVTIGATEVDGSVTNELQTFGHSGTTSYTNTLSSGGGSFTLQASTGIGISNSSGTVTFTNTGDVSNTNELQSYGHSGSTSYTNTLSLGGGSFTLQAGSGIGISNSSGTVTITATTLGTVTSVGVTAPAAGFTVSPSSITSSGTFVFSLANDLAALEALSGTGIAIRTGTSTWATYDFTDLYTGFNSGEVIYTDGSITPAGSSAFTYNSGSQLLTVTSATLSGGLYLTGSLCCLAPTNYVLSKRASDGLVFETQANRGYRQAYSSSTTISSDAEFVYISGSGTYTLPNVSSSSTAGQRMFIMNNSGGNITIASPGNFYVNGASGSYTLPDRTLLVLSGNSTNQWFGN